MRLFWITLGLILWLTILLPAQAVEYQRITRTTTVTITEADRYLSPPSYAEVEFWEGLVDPNDPWIMVNITVIAINCPDPLEVELEIGLREYYNKGVSTQYYDTELSNDSASPYNRALVVGDHFEYAFQDNLNSKDPHVLKLGISTLSNAKFTGSVRFSVSFQLSGSAYSFEPSGELSFLNFEWFFVLGAIISVIGALRRAQLRR
ncbi:MAG: hypothetical protein ACE5OZ_18605 [Candidatus Heimdallarchaeota archaeon]